jgi:hypothetical protein
MIDRVSSFLLLLLLVRVLGLSTTKKNSLYHSVGLSFRRDHFRVATKTAPISPHLLPLVRKF